MLPMCACAHLLRSVPALDPERLYTHAEIAAVLLVQALNRQGWKAVAVHGDASQAQRTAAVDSFKVRQETQANLHSLKAA